MNLLTQKEFADLAGVSKVAINKAIKTARLEYYKGSKKIDTDSPLAMAYLNNPTRQRTNNEYTPPVVSKIEYSEEFKQKLEEISLNAETSRDKYEEARAEKERQAARRIAMQNAVRECDLFTKESVMQIMFYIDRLHSSIDRLAGGFFDEIQKKILAAGKPSPDLKRQWRDEVKKVKHEAKNEFVDSLEKLEEDQARQ